MVVKKETVVAGKSGEATPLRTETRVRAPAAFGEDEPPYDDTLCILDWCKLYFHRYFVIEWVIGECIYRFKSIIIMGGCLILCWLHLNDAWTLC